MRILRIAAVVGAVVLAAFCVLVHDTEWAATQLDE